MQLVYWASVTLLFAPAVAGQRLSEPIRSADRPSLQGLSSKWSGGALIAWRTATSASERGQNLFLYDADGARRGYRLEIPDAAMVHIWDVAASPSTLAVAAQAIDASGTVAGLFALISRQSQSTTITQTSPFEPQRITIRADSTIWVLGYQLGEGRRVKAAPRHSILKQYTPEGRLIGEHLQWPGMACGLHPAIDHGEGNPALLALPGGVGLMLPACNEWLELDSAGNLARKVVWRYPGTADTLIFTVATGTGVFGYMDAHLFQLGLDTGRWDPVLQPDSVPAAAVPLGNDGNALVYESSGRIHWATVGP